MGVRKKEMRDKFIMPQFIESSFDIKLAVPSSNKRETAAFLDAKPKDFVLPDFAVPAGYQLVANAWKESEEGQVRTICLIYSGGVDAETVYKVKIIVRFEPNAHLPVKNCTQLIVWRQASGVHENVLSNFAKTVFNFLLYSHDIMITDEQQTEDGKRFWLNRMGESFTIAIRNVYFIDLDELDEDLSPKVESIDTYNDLMEFYVPKGWGMDKEHRNRAFIISTQKLL